MSILENTKKIWRRSASQKLDGIEPVNGRDSPQTTNPVNQGTKEPITLAVIGCGQRGKKYAVYATREPTKCKIVAIAEPRPKTQKRFAASHGVDRTLVFNTWQELHVASAETIKTVGKRLADAVVVAVQDHMHVEVVLAFAEQGYHILCEKPMATSIDECMKIEAAVKKAGIIFGMGHVLRYSPYNHAVSEIVRSGNLGELVNAVQIEPVGYYHFAHSYVRGNWKKESDSSFVLMTKCCHDIDILCHWFSDTAPSRVSSFGTLKHFRKSAKPAAAADATRCLNCPIEIDCAYSAKKIYLDPVSRGHTGWPVSTIIDGVPDVENVTEVLRNSSYGKCVYESDNNVCDNQVVNIEFDNGSTASFTMVAFTDAICDRQTHLHFTYGELIGDMKTFTVTDFRTRHTTTHHPKLEGGGHGGGDLGLMKTFIEAVRTGQQEILGTDVSEVLKSHLTVFAAEQSRREGKVVDYAKFEKAARDHYHSIT